MGCLHSSESLSTDEEEESEPAPDSADQPSKRKGDARPSCGGNDLEGEKKNSCKRSPQLQGIPCTRTLGKKSLKPNGNDSTERKSMERKPPSEQSEGMKIRVIWRRVSIFGGRRDSNKSSKSVEAELPGPSENSSLAPPAMSFNT